MTGEAELTAVAVSEEVREWLPVATMADLRLMKPTAKRFIQLLGYYSAGDGGGGEFYWDSASSATDNGGTIIAPDAGGTGRWRRIYDGDLNALWFGADPTGVSNSATFIQTALDLLENVFVPQGLYRINTALKLRESGQRLYGAGYGGSSASSASTVGSILKWYGTSGNFIEVLSGRRDAADTGLTETGMELSGFKLESSDGSTALDNAIWIEDGVFHTFIEKVHIRNFGVAPAESYVKFDSGGGLSYPVGIVMRDVTIRQSNTTAAIACPKGIFLESAIEAYFDRVFVYDCEDCWVFGTSVEADYRNVQNITLAKCMGEIGDSRGHVSTNGACFRVYAGTNIYVDGTKLNPAEGFSVSTSQCALRLSGVGSQTIENVIFQGCEFLCTVSAADTYAIVVDSGAGSPSNIVLDNSRITRFEGGFANINAAATPQIIVTPTCVFSLMPEPIVSLTARGFTLDPAEIADGAGLSSTLSTAFYKRGSEPALVSCSNDLQGLIATHYKSSASDVNLVLRLQNETGGAIDLASSVFRFRPFAAHEIKAQATISYDPASLADGAGATATLTVPGAALGDFVAVAFKNLQTNNLSGILLTGYVSAADTVSARFQNETGGTINLTAGNLTAYVLAPKFTYAGSATYDPPSLADAELTTTTVTVTGAALGDFAVASFSLDLQGITMTAYVSAANTVTVVFANESGGVLDISSGTLRAGVYDNGVIQGVP